MRLMSSVAILTFVAAAAASAQERRITRQQLPPAVARAVAEQSQGATIRGYSQEKEKGRTFYEVELTVNGHHKDVLMDTTGSVVEIEEAVALADVPAPVHQGLMAAIGTGRGRIRSVESITRQGQVVAYEAQVLKDGKRAEIVVGPDGKRIRGEP